MNYTTWNKLSKPEECNVVATSEDKLCFTGGYAFLVMTKHDINNVVCFHYLPEGKTTFKEALRTFLYWCQNNCIQYLRVEGSVRRYNFLTNSRFLPGVKKHLKIIKDNSITDRNVFYVKVY